MANPDGYIPSEYLPGDKVLAMNNLPRFQGGNTFDATDSEYLGGVVLIAIPFALLGLCLSLIILCITCCKSKNQNPDRHRSVCCPWVFSLLFLLLVFLGAVVAGNGNEVAGGAVDKAQAALTSVQNFLTEATSLAQQTSSTASSSSTALSEIESLCPQVQSQVSDFRIKVDALSDRIDGFDVSTLADSLQSVQDPIAEYEASRYQVVVAGLVFVFMLILVYALGLLQMGALHKVGCLTSCFACLGCLLLLFSVFVIIFMWVVTGLGILVSTFLADFCVAPDASFVSVVGLSQANVSAVSYYQTCQGPPPDSVVSILEQANTLIADAEASLTNLDLLSPTCVGPQNIDSQVAGLFANVNDARGILQQAETLVACESINPLYRSFIDEFLCTDLIGSLVQFWAGAFLIGFFLTLMQLSFRVLTNRRQEQELLREEDDVHSGGSGSKTSQRPTRLEEVNVRERY